MADHSDRAVQRRSAEVIPLHRAAGRREQRDRRSAMDRFLASVERRGLRMAELATGDREEALELVQEAMLKLVERYARKPEAEWPLLFQRVLQHKIRDWYRRRSVRRRVMAVLGRDDDDPIARAPDPNGRPIVDQLAASEATQRLIDGIARLPLRQQQAFLLRTWDGFDVAETAYAMGCSSGSVKTHFARAVERLRAHLEEYMP